MGSKIPAQHYVVGSNASFISSTLHDLNSVDPRSGTGIVEVEADARSKSMDGDDGSSPVDCLHDTYGNSLAIHNVGVSIEEDPSGVEPSVSMGNSYDMLTIEDVLPIESSRARFLQIIVDHFICDHVVEVNANENMYTPHSGLDKLNKRKSRDVQYEGDPRFALPLMYIANMYESLVNDVNLRLVTLSGVREKTIGVALEAAGGLYRKIVKKYPKKGSCIFRRRELATSLETRTRFPELVIQEEKRVRFVVVNGLDIVENPTSMSLEDAGWFKRLTGRNEVSISARDYKFYSPRHKYRRSGSTSSTSPLQQPQSSPKQHVQRFLNQPQFHTIQSPLQHNQPVSHFTHGHCGSPSQLPSISESIGYIQPMGGHVSGRLHLMPSGPAKFCDECGAQYLRDTSKFCSACGEKRPGM